MKIAVWFSCGAASAAALKLTVDKYGADNVYAVNNPVIEEHHDNKRFAEDVAKWVGIDIQYAVNSNIHWHLWLTYLTAARAWLSHTAHHVRLSLKSALAKSGRKAIQLIGMSLALLLMSATGMTGLL